jgi:hypothetical protein
MARCRITVKKGQFGGLLRPRITDGGLLRQDGNRRTKAFAQQIAESNRQQIVADCAALDISDLRQWNLLQY